MATDSVDLIVTSIPFATQYEYTPSYNDFGHTDGNAHFFAADGLPDAASCCACLQARPARCDPREGQDQASVQSWMVYGFTDGQTRSTPIASLFHCQKPRLRLSPA